MKSGKKSKRPASLLDEQNQTIEKIGERIKQLRLKKGYTSAENFALDHDIDRSQYGKIERGTNMRTTTLVIMLRHFDITIDEFFSEGFDF